MNLGERGRIIAGGTGIYEVVHRGLITDVETLIDISGLNLSYFSLGRDFLRIGATTTLSELARSSELAARDEFSAISDALNSIQPPQVKNVATIGGAICTALPFLDLPVALQCLNAEVRLAPSGVKKKIDEFMIGYFAIALEQGEFVSEIELPLARDGSRRSSAFQKFAATHDDWALINCGVSLSVDQKRRIAEPVIVLGGGVGEKPMRVKSTEDALSGTEATDVERIKTIFSNSIPKEIKTVSDFRASSDYRLQLAKVLAARATTNACKRSMSALGGK